MSSYYKEYYKKELENKETNYFILDTSGPNSRGDVDFEIYMWETSRYNKVKAGDLFIYRRQQKASEMKGEFYFFGCGKIERIIEGENKEVKGVVSKPLVFSDNLLQSQLNDFKWNFKERGTDWAHFFNEYGMNQITREDFENLSSLAFTDIPEDEEFDTEKQVEFFQSIQNKIYRVEDQYMNTKTRGAAQKVFADAVKLNASYRCAITGITNRNFLIGSHIKPWAVDIDNRLNPSNGICLSSLVDRAFDKGFITIGENYKVLLSNKLKDDPQLLQSLELYNSKKIHLGKVPPNKDFLKWHRENIFKK